jgi:hypothetical protein
MSEAPDRGEADGVSGGGWAPLRFPLFRHLWSAQFASNVGSWMRRWLLSG